MDKMTARGIDFLDVWIDINVPQQKDDLAKAEMLADKLVADAAARGFTIDDLDLGDYSVTKFIRQSMAAPRV